ncbi:uncharacterized protein BX663DRAFT_439478, partial [Cokeromyces recurvatus]|uniref:uncharacterized protein n=1 Tax=Cokeromyces recurvatus TaxID=90255 RepID=UPI0022210239
FSNLLGTVYTGGNVIFTPDGNSILSPVGNRVSVFDLVKYVICNLHIGSYAYFCLFTFISNTSYTLPFEMRQNIDRMALSPNGAVLITVDKGNFKHV